MMTERSHVLITGDFNQRDIDWSDNLSPKDPDCKATDILESVRDSFLCHLVKEPTHYQLNPRPNVLDLVFTNEKHHQTLHFSYICYSEDEPPQKAQYNFPQYGSVKG